MATPVGLHQQLRKLRLQRHKLRRNRAIPSRRTKPSGGLLWEFIMFRKLSKPIVYFPFPQAWPVFRFWIKDRRTQQEQA
jgi:hypothetical protein